MSFIKPFILAGIVSAFAVAAFASEPGSNDVTLLIVRKQSGFVAAEQSYKIQCQVNADKTNKVWQSGRDSTVHDDNKPTVFTGRLKDVVTVTTYLKYAARGGLQRRQGATDRPTSRYVGILEGVVVDQYVKLLIDKSTNIWKNNSPATDALLEFADANCSLP